jgi:signal transduction histidine kinase
MEEIAERTRLVIERAEAEQQLLELNATLEQRIEARTNELRSAQEALLQSQKMEAIGQLVSGLAHDFNNVLAAIVSALELIDRRSSDPDKVQKFAKAGLQATDRGARLVSQLLAFSRSQRIQLRPIFVCDVIDDMTDMLARTLGPMIQITYSTNPSPVPVLGDPVQIEMMLLNLAINARDAMPNGGELTIATSVVKVANDSEVADGEYVELSVADTGAGMDETTLRRALEPFFTTKPAGKGTGLGLAQIYGSARQSGGTVRLESRLDEGTKVRVLLPTTDLPVEYSATVESSNQAKGVRYEILLVDDEQSTRQLLADSLRDLEHVVIEAADGKTALTMLANNMVDIALLDFAMPVMNGAVLASHIRQRWPDLPILFASGYSDTNAIEQALGGSALILQKPVKATDVVAAINILLER